MIREESSQENLRVALENWEPVAQLVLRAATHYSVWEREIAIAIGNCLSR